MAITKTYINGDAAALGAFLQTLVPDFFASVEDDTSTTTAGDYRCMDADGNTVAVVKTTAAGSIYADASHSIAMSFNMPAAYGYRTACGAVLRYNSGTSTAYMVFAKTNLGAFGGMVSNGSAAYQGFRTVAWGDQVDNLAATFGGLPSAGVATDQTVLCPVPTHGALGTPSVLEGVYFLPWAQSRAEGEIVIDGTHYFSTGYLAIKDE